MLDYKFLPTAFATYLNEIFYLSQRFGIFFLFEKENACKRKATYAHKKANKVRPYGLQNELFRRFYAACAATVCRVAAPYKLQYCTRKARFI